MRLAAGNTDQRWIAFYASLSAGDRSLAAALAAAVLLTASPDAAQAGVTLVQPTLKKVRPSCTGLLQHHK
jgi:hypothetical protein